MPSPPQPRLVFIAPYAWDDFARECETLCRVWYHTFNVRDPVALRIVILDRPKDRSTVEALSDGLAAVLNRDFFFLKDYPALEEPVFAPGFDPDEPGTLPLRTRTVAAGGLGDPSGWTRAVPVDPFAMLDAAYARMDREALDSQPPETVTEAEMTDAQRTTFQHWDKRPEKRSPMNFPPYRDRYHTRITGAPDRDAYAWFARHLGAFPAESAFLSLGCGGGGNEMDLLKHIPEPARFEAFDLSRSRIAEAAAAARNLGYRSLHYHVRDIQYLFLPRGRYRMVMAFHCLHHFHNLERVFWEVERSLAPGGLFLVHDYCGPTRMQFGSLQEAWIDRMVQAIPPHLRTVNDLPDRIKLGFRTPSEEVMINIDFSEGIRSGEIDSLLRSRFDVVAEAGAGGTLLAHALNGIENNFDPADAEHMRLIQGLVDLEDSVLHSGGLGHDLRCYVLRKR